MQYLMLIYSNEAAEAKMSESERQAQMGEYFGFTTAMRERGVYVSGEALHATTAATTLRVREGKTLTTDGPFAETHEQLGGYYVLDCKDIDEALECASKIPTARSGSIEIRPLVVFS